MNVYVSFHAVSYAGPFLYIHGVFQALKNKRLSRLKFGTLCEIVSQTRAYLIAGKPGIPIRSAFLK
jgi:hypothetical protein